MKTATLSDTPAPTAPAGATEELRSVLDRDRRAWREFVQRYDPQLREVVRQALQGEPSLPSDLVDEVLGDFWLEVAQDNLRLLRVFDPARGSALLTWLTFHVARVTYRHLENARAEPERVSLRRARNVADPRPLPAPALRRENVADTIDAAIRHCVRDAIANELPIAISGLVNRSNPALASEEGFISIARAAELAATHPSTIRAWIRQGRLSAGRTGRHYKVKRADLTALIEGSTKDDLDKDPRRLAAVTLDKYRHKLL